MALRRALSNAFGSIGQSAQTLARGMEPQVRRRATGAGAAQPGTTDWFTELLKQLGIQPPGESMTMTAPKPTDLEG